MPNDLDLYAAFMVCEAVDAGACERELDGWHCEELHHVHHRSLAAMAYASPDAADALRLALTTALCLPVEEWGFELGEPTIITLG